MTVQTAGPRDLNEQRQLSMCEAALALSGKDRVEAAKLLRALSREGSQKVRKRAAECFLEIGGERAVVALRNLLRDRNHEIRATAAMSLGCLQSREAKSELSRMLDSDPHIEVQLAVARALGRLSDRSGFQMVSNMIGSTNKRHQRLGVVALRDIIGQKFSPDQEGVDAARRYLQVQGEKLLTGD